MFFNFLDNNTSLKEAFEVIKKEKMMLNVNLSKYRLMSTRFEFGNITDNSLSSFNTEFKN